jgi:hypothetical protein
MTDAPLDIGESGIRGSAKQLEASLQKLQEASLYMDYLMFALP